LASNVTSIEMSS